MEILENKAQWATHYQENWLAQAQKTGVADWKIYHHPRNKQVPGMSGVQLDQARLLFVTSSGAYLSAEQRPFDAASLYGDYTMRTFPVTTPFTALAFAHDHYDQTFVNQDPQAALPLRRLEAEVTSGRIGSLAPEVLSFTGYQPDSARVVDELVPPLVAAAQAQGANAALLAPVWPICHQSVGLIARALEMAGLATVVVAWNGGRIRLVNPPRVVITRLQRGVVFGNPHDTAQQERVLQAALALLEKPAPVEPVTLDET